MAIKRSQKSKNKRHKTKVGSSARAAKSFAGQTDFGAPESDVRQRTYVSEATKSQDKSSTQERSIGRGLRVSGVGSRASGPGSGSGGDLDPDIVGVGTGGVGLSQSGGTDELQGPDMTTGSSSEFASGSPSRGKSGVDPKVRKIVKGSTVDHGGGDITSTGGSEGAAAVTNPHERGMEDSFAGEISLDEASGADNSPSDR